MFTPLISALVVAASPTHDTSTPDVDHARVARRSLGLGLGGLRLFTPEPSMPDLVVPLTLEARHAFGDTGALFLRVPLGVGHVAAGAPTSSGNGLVLVTGGQVGVQYAFGQTFVRPFVGAQLTGLFVLSSAGLLAGPGVTAGLETAPVESFVFHLVAQGDWFVALNGPQRFSVGGALSVSTVF